MNLRHDIALSAVALLLPACAMMGTALALLKPAPLPTHQPPAKIFTERFDAAFAVLPQPPVDPDEPVPLPPVRPPPEPVPEPLPEPSAPGGAVARSSGLRMVAADICARYGGRRVETGRSWRCAYPRGRK